MAICEMPRQTKPLTLAREVGERIRQARKASGLTLQELADLCGTTPQTMQRLEAATMTLSIGWVESICAALRIEPGALFDGRFDLEEAHLKLQSEARVLVAHCENFIARLNAFLEQSDD
jgi:transcriptional regulator with XRE-family HTH domain